MLTRKKKAGYWLFAVRPKVDGKAPLLAFFEGGFRDSWKEEFAYPRFGNEWRTSDVVTETLAGGGENGRTRCYNLVKAGRLSRRFT